VQGQTGLLPHVHRPIAYGGRDVGNCGIQRIAAVVRIHGNSRMVGRDGKVQFCILGGSHLDNEVHAVRRDTAHLGRGIRVLVVDDIIGPGRCRKSRFLGGADRGDDGPSNPSRKLDRRVPNCSRATGNEYDVAVERADFQPGWTIFGNRERPVRGYSGHPEACTKFEARGIGERMLSLNWQYSELLPRAAARSLMCGERKPDAVPHAQARHVRTDGINDPGTVLVRHDLRERQHLSWACTAARFPVRGVHARVSDTHAIFAVARLRNAAVDEMQD
jgi:hypothetical protein